MSCVKPFIRIWVQLKRKWPFKRNTFSYEWFCMKAHFQTTTYHKWPIPWLLKFRTTNSHIKRLIENWIQWLFNSLGLHLHFHLCVDFVRFRDEFDLNIGIWVTIRVHRDEILCLPHCKITTTRKQVLKRISYLTNLGLWYPNLLPKGTPTVYTCTKETWFCRLQSGRNAYKQKVIWENHTWHKISLHCCTKWEQVPYLPMYKSTF